MDPGRTIVFIVKSEMAIIAIGGISMGKVALRVLAMMMVLSLGAATAFAASPGSGGNYVDADGNGVCTAIPWHFPKNA